MIKYFKTLFFCVVGISCFAFFFAFSPIALATDVLDQQQAIHGNAFSSLTWAQSFKQAGNNLSRLYVQENYGSCEVYLCLGEPEDINRTTCQGHIKIRQFQLTGTTTIIYPAISLIPEQAYYFGFNCPNLSPYGIEFTGNGTNYYSRGYLCYSGSCENNSYDLAFATYSDSRYNFDYLYNATSTLSTYMDNICSGIATSTLAGGLECIIKRSITWAFFPSSEALNQLAASADTLKEAFPFNAYFGLTDAISAGLATTSTSTTGSFKMPMITATGTFYMLPVLTASSMPNLIGQANYTIFRNSLGYILWCLAGFIVFITFKKI